MKYLTWLCGTALISGGIALVSNFVLKTLHDEAEIQALNHSTRGGIVGAIAGLAFGAIGTPAAKNKASGWREKIFSAAKKNIGRG